jgi:hypothetical protein
MSPMTLTATLATSKAQSASMWSCAFKGQLQGHLIARDTKAQPSSASPVTYQNPEEGS